MKQLHKTGHKRKTQKKNKYESYSTLLIEISLNYMFKELQIRAKQNIARHGS